MASFYIIDFKLMKSLVTLLVALVSICLTAQNDTIFFIKNGQVIAQHSIKSTDVDSVIFYRPKHTTQPIEISFVDIPAGTFTMGSPETEANRNPDETQHQVTLSAFKMSKYEITNAQFAAFLNSKGIGSDGIYAFGVYPNEKLIFQNEDYGLVYSYNCWSPVSGHENHPVIKVTWYGALEFANFINAKLPTEAQWEYACRAGTTTPFNTGNCLTNEHANYNWYYTYANCINNNNIHPGKTQAVGSYPSNNWGLHDMHGNVWEWCYDNYETYTIDPTTDPIGPTSGKYRIYRGGSWVNQAEYCRSAYRYSFFPNESGKGLGFRVVINP